MKSSFLKHLERQAKSFLYQSIFARIFRNKPAPLPLDKSKVKTILLIRRDMIGDMILTTSGIEFLNRIMPDAKIDVFCSPKGAMVLEHNPRVSRLFVADLKSLTQTLRTAFQLRKHHYDLILALTIRRTTQDGLLANLISKKAIKSCILLKKSADLYPVLFNAPVDITDYTGQETKSLFENLHYFLAKLFGEKVDLPSVKQELFIAESEKKIAEDFLREKVRGQFVVFNTSARLPEKEWGLHNASQFLKAVSQRFPNLVVVVSCDVDEREAVEKVLGELACKNVMLAPKVHFRVLSHLISKAQLLISPDTALVHVAATFNVPSVILCAREHSGIEFTPMGKHENIWADAGTPITSIPPELVLSRVQSALMEINQNSQ